MNNRVVQFAFGVLILFLAWAALSSLSVAAPRIAFSLIVGWLGFLARVIPAMQVNWSGIGMAVGCSVLIVVGLHSLAVWIFAHVTRTVKQASASSWRWSWSLSLYLGLWLVFMAIMGAVGVVHQVGWLVRSKEPLMVQTTWRGIERIDLPRFAMELQTAAVIHGWKADSLRKDFAAISTYTRRPVLEDYHMVPLVGERGEVTAAVVFPRDAEALATTGFVVVTPDKDTDFYPAEALRSFLANKGTSLDSLRKTR